MAAALHALHDAPVHGIPEITLLATTPIPAHSAEIKFDGLWTEEITDYLRNSRCGTYGIWQAPKLHVQFEDESGKNVSPAERNLANKTILIERDLEHALRCYVLSRVPVVMPVDVGRMQGLSTQNEIRHYAATKAKKRVLIRLDEPFCDPSIDSIFKKNGLTSYLQPAHRSSGWHESTLATRSHVVLVVGCSEPNGPLASAMDGFSDLDADGRAKDVEPPATDFIFQDPAHFPFMKATAHDFLISSCYNEAIDTGKQTRNENFKELLLGWFLPVTASAVKMPLLDEASDTRNGTVRSQAGLKSISLSARRTGFDFLGIRIHLPLTVRATRSEFRLIQLNRETFEKLLQHLSQYYFPNASWGKNIRSITEALIPADSPKWSWLEVDSSFILLWDAERKPIDFQTLISLNNEATRSPLGDYLLGASFCTFEQCVARTTLTLFSKIEENRASPVCEGKLQKAVISSFETTNPSKWVAEIMPGAPIEIYLFMQQAAEKNLMRGSQQLGLLGRRWMRNIACSLQLSELPRRNIRQSALMLMALSVNSATSIGRAADYVERIAQECCSDAIGIATYLPGLCVLMRGKNPAIEALRFVLKVVQELRRRDKAQALRTVELIGGSRVTGPLRLTKNRDAFYLPVMSSNHAVANLLDSIDSIISDVELANVSLAFEYEHSTLCALGNLDSIENFASQIREKRVQDARWNRVGLNLDIAHWGFLGGIRPDEVSRPIRELVRHAHISTHTRGHFADSYLEGDAASAIQHPSQFQEWIQFLESIPPEHFSGYVSLELECCKSKSALEQSWRTLNHWLTKSE